MIFDNYMTQPFPCDAPEMSFASGLSIPNTQMTFFPPQFPPSQIPLSQFPPNFLPYQNTNSTGISSSQNSQITFIQSIKANLITQLETFFSMIGDCLLKNEKIVIMVIDLDKTAKFNYDEGRYVIPEDNKNFKYNEYDLYSSSKKIAQIIKIASILYEKTLVFSSSTKRELYYIDPELFKSTDQIDSILNDLCSILFINRFELPIFPSAKGLFCGNMKLINEKGFQMNIGNNTNYNKINLITYDYLTENFTIQFESALSFILIVEKETLFFNLIENNEFLMNFPNAIIITGKGYPDYITKYFINKISKQVKIPMFYFGDNDPHGFEIFLNYLFGSKTSARENEFLSTNGIKWIGLATETIDKIRYDIERPSEEGLIQLSERDIKKIELMRQREYFSNDKWLVSTNPETEIIVRNLNIINNELYQLTVRGRKAEGEFVLSKYPNLFIENIKSNLVL